MSDGEPPLLAYRSGQSPTVPSVVCPKCQTRMEPGTAFTGHGRAVRGRSLWVAGLIRRGFLGGRLLPKGKWYELIAFRCPGCGFVEHYCPPG